MSLKLKFAQEAYRARMDLGLTQEQVASVVSISTRDLQYVEKGTWLPKGETMLRLMIALQINTNLFCEETGVYPLFPAEKKPTRRCGLYPKEQTLK